MLLSPLSRPSIPASLLVPTGLLLLAYIYALCTRPPLPDYVKLRDPGVHGWPAWWGQKGPIDDASLRRSEGGGICAEKRDVLLFIDLAYDSLRMPYAIQVLETLTNNDNVEVDVLSPYKPGWTGIAAAFAGAAALVCPEIIWRIGEGVRDWEGVCPESIIISEIYSHHQEAAPSDIKANVTIVQEPHHLVAKANSFESLNHTHGPGWEMGLFTHVLPQADSYVYYPSRTGDNRKSMTYFPRPHTPRQDYPRLPWGKDWSLFPSAPPVPPSLNLKKDPFALDSAYRRYWRREEARQAEVMRHTGVCVFEDWEKGPLDDRIAKAMLSGCLVVTVPPEVQRDALIDLVLPVAASDASNSASSGALPVDEIRSQLVVTPPEVLRRRILDAHIFAHDKLSTTARARAVFDAVKKWENGGRGYLFPNGWRWSCEGHQDTPPWCM